MDQTNWWVIDIIGPSILLLVLIWLVIKAGPTSNDQEGERSGRGPLDRDEGQSQHRGTNQL